MSFFGINFGGGAEIDIILDDSDSRKMADVKDENGRKERFYLFYDGESVSGKVNITLHRKTGRLEHQGIKIEFLGLIELYYDRGNHHEFLSLSKELARPGDLTQNTSFDFEFNQVEKPYETYAGVNVRLRYFLRVTMGRRLTDLTKELDLAVQTLATYPEMNNPIKMEVGIEECLHIEFEYNKSKYHLKDVIVGKIYFLLVRIKIKHMEIAIIKRETCGIGPNTYHENENIAKYEIMDGAPVRGESIPIRVFLAGYDLTPTMRDINKKFSVRYYLNLVLVDEEDRRYFKQQEITLWRKGERSRKLPLSGSLYQQQHALARHTAGDLPTEGVRTAPTPSLPPTPCIDSKPFPDSDHLDEQIEEESTDACNGNTQVPSLPTDTQAPSLLTEPAQPDPSEPVAEARPDPAVAPPDLVSGTEDLSIKDTEEDVDSTKDLDVVSGGGTPSMSPPEMLDTPPEMLDTPPEMPGTPPDMVEAPPSPDIDLPDAPDSEPGSPKAAKAERVAATAEAV